MVCIMKKLGYNIRCKSDVPTTKLSVPYNNSSTDPITVDNIGVLTSFENVELLQQIPDILKLKMR